ncbi:phosphonate transporter [Pandoraea soli]|uniref:Phosphonate transporter n=1 Tax=Pandoraea soli TaxID=2508293 RepID=A0ABY6VPU9_9BURK|nr:phosphonate transporter [Pandoraea soli]VVD73817.1 phosphonate transporter [Pandoraea soli]
MENVDKGFERVSIRQLVALDAGQLDELPYGVIGFTFEFHVTAYNASESRNAGLSPSRVLNRHIFAEVAPCMNNFMVAQRFLDCATLDDIIPYVLTLRMRPTPVRLRLLKSPDVATCFLLIDRQVTN